MDMTIEAQLASWWLLFAGTHIIGSSLPVRKWAIGRLGLMGFKALYSVVSFATFGPLVWVLWFGRHAGPALFTPVAGATFMAEVLMLAALMIHAQGYATLNPMSSVAEIKGKTKRRAVGIQRITRHPVNMGLALFGLAHCLTNPYLGDLIFWGGFPLFSMTSAWTQDTRLLETNREHFEPFMRETSILPFWAILTGRQTLVWSELKVVPAVLGIVVFGLLRWAHPHLIGGFAS